MTLKDYILRWQEVYDKNQSRPTTYATHSYIFKNHILPGLGEIQLSELTVEQVGDFLEERRALAVIARKALNTQGWGNIPCGTSTGCSSNVWIRQSEMG